MAQEEQKEKQEKSMTEEEAKVAQKSAEKEISKEEAEKEVAKEEVKEETGYNAETLAGVAHTAMKASDSAGRSDFERAENNRAEVKGNAVEGMLEKMADSKVTQNILKAGIGSEFLSTGESGLRQGAQMALDIAKTTGVVSGIEERLLQAALDHSMTIDEIRNMTPETLKEKLDAMKQKNDEKPEADRTEDKPVEQPDLKRYPQQDGGR